MTASTVVTSNFCSNASIDSLSTLPFSALRAPLGNEMGYAHAMAEHVGGWTHIEVWVEVPHLTDMVDDVVMMVYEHAKQYGVDPYIDGSLDADPPEWAQ